MSDSGQVMSSRGQEGDLQFLVPGFWFNVENPSQAPT
jgi:hypothetical protein